ncbi:hypothetical protein F5Y17DRAFT_440251 [Xylariaceae sp. FL0594]|nr:hypothetical protein F5Y17DRAFT_440251 [Xylariaceae sp. FL0594]
MRTRRQDKAAAAAAAEAQAEAQKEQASPAVKTLVAKSDDVPQDAPKPPATLTISKIEEPTVHRPESKAQTKLPPLVQFFLVAILSFTISELGYSVSLPFTKSVLAAHSRFLGTWAEVGAITGWRLFELALGWYGKFDGYDITALNLLSHGPPLYLLYAHYETHPAALFVTVVIETLATYIPFRLLRPLASVHANPTGVPNADILTDKPIALLTTLLAGTIYSVSLLFAYATYLPTYLVVYFAGIPSLVRAHESNYIGLLPVTLALGFAARAFIFTPSEATGRTPADEENERFDPVKANLRETVKWNFLGWSSQTKVAMKRTALVMFVTGINTFLQTWLTITGVEAVGAAAWSSVWVFASAVTGLALGAVGNV